jgi:hypothetical protein
LYLLQLSFDVVVDDEEEKKRRRRMIMMSLSFSVAAIAVKISYLRRLLGRKICFVCLFHWVLRHNDTGLMASFQLYWWRKTLPCIISDTNRQLSRTATFHKLAG